LYIVNTNITGALFFATEVSSASESCAYLCDELVYLDHLKDWIIWFR